MLIGRVLPVVRTFIALPAGIGRMRQLPFQIYTFVGSFAWCYLLAAIGAALGRRWESDPRLRAVMGEFHIVIAVLVVAGVGWFLWHKWRGHRA